MVKDDPQLNSIRGHSSLLQMSSFTLGNPLAGRSQQLPGKNIIHCRCYKLLWPSQYHHQVVVSNVDMAVSVPRQSAIVTVLNQGAREPTRENLGSPWLMCRSSDVCSREM